MILGEEGEVDQAVNRPKAFPLAQRPELLSTRVPTMVVLLVDEGHSVGMCRLEYLVAYTAQICFGRTRLNEHVPAKIFDEELLDLAFALLDLVHTAPDLFQLVFP